MEEENNSDTEKSLEVEQSDANIGANGKRISWAKLLSRVFALDMTNCNCGGQMRAISAVIKQDVVVKILTHLGLPARAPPISESKFQRQGDFWDQTPHCDDSQII